MKLFRAFSALVFSFAFSAITFAADWSPSGPITMMIAFKAGGGADTQARLIAEELEARHGWKIVPKQVTGKGGSVLAAAIKDEPNDGSVIGIAVTETYGYNMVAAKNPGYSASDATYLTTTSGFQMGVVAKTDKGWKSFDEVVAAAKGGQEIRFGAMSPRLADLAYLLAKAQGIEFNIVMVKGGKGVMNGLNAGDLDIGWGAGIQAKAVRAGDMVNLLSGLTVPLAVSPDAPLMKDYGVDYDAGGHFLFVAPAGVSDEARNAIGNAIAEIAADPDSKAGQFINKAFGGPDVIKGADLDNLMSSQAADAESLLKEASE